MRQHKSTARAGRAAAILRRLPEDRPLSGAEIGVARGKLSAILLRQRPLLTLTMVDLWAANTSPTYAATNDRYATLPAGRFKRMHTFAIRSTRFAKERCVLVQADSVEGATTIPDHSLDFAFIDDDHSRSGCERSIKAWFPKIKPGGWIGGHDYGHTNPRFKFGVTDAVHQYFDPLQIKIETDKNSTWFAFVDPQLVHYKGA